MNPESLLASLFVSSVGYVAFAYGKRQRRAPHILAGLSLMLFPYFVDSASSILLIGGALSLLLWLASRFGW